MLTPNTDCSQDLAKTQPNGTFKGGKKRGLVKIGYPGHPTASKSASMKRLRWAKYATQPLDCRVGATMCSMDLLSQHLGCINKYSPDKEILDTPLKRSR